MAGRGRNKTKLILGNEKSLEKLLSEVYNDATNQIIEAQEVINTLDNETNAETVDDYAKIAKEKTNAIKLKDSATKVKLDIAKLQTEIYKNKIKNLPQKEEELGNNSSSGFSIEEIKKLHQEGLKGGDDDKLTRFEIKK